MNNAEQLILEAGHRPTASRIAVLNVLIGAQHAFAHPEIMQRLSATEPFDRVTLYRVLDWLMDKGLIHAIMGHDRARRFQLTQKNALHQHAHFKCTQCSQVFCLDSVQAKLPSQIPEHFTVESIELNIKGQCADCIASKP